jgi:enoyl-CoA hydratase/carnithine racemase
LELSLLADITLASPAAQFGLPEIRHGGGPGAAMLPWVVGMKAAKWLMLTGQRIDAGRALEMGLVTQVVADDELESSSLKVAGDLASIPSVALKLTKLALNRTYERMGLLSAVDENFTISTVMNATAAYREQEEQRQSMPLKEFLRKRDGGREEVSS